MTSNDSPRAIAIPRQTTGEDDARRRHLDAIFRPQPGPTPLALDVSAPAVRAIIRLFLDIKAVETERAPARDPRPRIDLQDVVEAWFARIGLGLDQSATSLLLGLIRGWRDPGLELAVPQSCYGQECYGEGCCGSDPELPDAHRHSGSAPAVEEPTDAAAEGTSVPLALALYGDRCAGGPGESSDPDVLVEVAAELLGDVFDLARQGGLEPDDLVARAVRLLSELTVGQAESADPSR